MVLLSMREKTLTFITGNAAKAEQLGRHLELPVRHQKIDLEEIQSLDLRKIVDHKSREAYKQVGGPVLVEDVSLTFSALNRLPGPLIKWFLTDLGNEGLCRLLDGYNDRTAIAEVCFGYFNGKEVEYFDGKMQGSIAESPRGERGFGWDPIFIPAGQDKTWGEMTPEEQKDHSMRRIALKKLESFLKNN